MKKTLILHIGMPKTGTSTIQNTLKLNKKILAENKILYPDFEEFKKFYENKNFYSTGNGNPLAYAMRKDLGENSIKNFFSFNEVVKDIISKFVLNEYKMLIISHEDLLYMSSKQIEFINQLSIENNIELTAIFYIREQVSFHISNYQQHIKQLKKSFSFGEYLTNRLEFANYLNFIEKWTNMLTNKQFIVKLLDRRIIKTDLCSHFLNSINLTENYNLQISSDHNTSLGHLATELFKKINKNSNKINEEEKKYIQNFIYSQALSKIDQKLSISKEESDIIKNYYVESNTKIAKYYLTQEEKHYLLGEE